MVLPRQFRGRWELGRQIKRTKMKKQASADGRKKENSMDRDPFQGDV